jgi:inner membrane protein
MGVLPDIDTLFGGDDLTYIQTHRGITHSIAGVAAAGLVVAWVAGRLGVRGSYAGRYAISVGGMLFHILFDVLTSYGTQIFAPFTDYRAAVDVLFIIDPYMTGILLLGLVLGWRANARWYRIGFATFSAYVLMNAALHGYGFGQLDRWASEEGIDYQRSAVMPTPFSPLHRRGFVESGDRTYWTTVDALGTAGGVVVEYDRALTDSRLGFVWETDAGKAYRWFARFLVITSVNGPRIVIEDLTYKVRDAGLGWLGKAALEWMQRRNPDFVDRRIFWIEADTESREVMFRR